MNWQKNLGKALLRFNNPRGVNPAVLIDDCDAPMLEVIEDKEELKRRRAVLHKFLSILTQNRARLSFVMITALAGHSFLDPNDKFDMYDLSIYPDLAALSGFTELEFELYFAPYLDEAVKMLNEQDHQMQWDRARLVNALRKRYSGFAFAYVKEYFEFVPYTEEAPRLFAPLPVLTFLSNPASGFPSYSPTGDLDLKLYRKRRRRFVQGDLMPS